MHNLDMPTLVVVLLVVAGAGWLTGYLSGRREKEQTQRQRVQARRANRLRHRAPELEPDTDQGADTVVDEPTEEQPALTGYQRFAGLAAGSSTPRTLSPDWHRQFDHIVELYGPAPRPDDEPTPFYDQVSAALVMPTAEWLLAGDGETNPWDKPQPGPPSPKPQIRSKRKKHAHGGVR